MDAVKDPARIRWRFGTIDSEATPPVVLEGGVMLCPRHPQMPVTYKCTHCHEVMCDSCVHIMQLKGGTPLFLCTLCSHKCEPVEVVQLQKKKKTFIGYLQETSATKQLETANPALYQTVTVEKNYLLGAYKAIDPVKSAAVTEEKLQTDLKTATTTGQFSALGKMAMFPLFMLACYLALIAYFKTKGLLKKCQRAGNISNINNGVSEFHKMALVLLFP